jgi:hypothetical protein
MVLESSQVLPWRKCFVTARTSRPRARENELQNPVSLREAGDGMQLGDAAEEGKDKTSTLRNGYQSCRMKGGEGNQEAGTERRR